GRVRLRHVSRSSFPFCFKAEKKKGRSATFYPLDNTPFLHPVDETQLPALNSSMEPVGVSTEMALLSNILAAYAFITVDGPSKRTMNTESKFLPFYTSNGDIGIHLFMTYLRSRHRRFERTLNMNVFTSAEELERAQRLEERERIIREIWMNGQPDIPGTRSLNRYY
ncbi:hypothetical protein Q9233_014734, partial [Columba guinea]